MAWQQCEGLQLFKCVETLENVVVNSKGQKFVSRCHVPVHEDLARDGPPIFLTNFDKESSESTIQVRHSRRQLFYCSDTIAAKSNKPSRSGFDTNIGSIVHKEDRKFETMFPHRRTCIIQVAAFDAVVRQAI